MSFGSVSKAEVMLRLRSEFDSRHPKMRLSLITYLLEKDVIPDPANPEAYINMLDGLAEWVGREQEEFMATVQSLEDVEVETDEKGEDPRLGSAYL